MRDEPPRWSRQFQNTSDQSDHDMITRLTLTMWGVAGNNGVVGTQRDHTTRIAALEQFKKEIQALRETARWIALGVCALIGWAITDPAAAVIARVARALGASQ